VKYFLLGAFSSGFILYGMALIYGETRTLDLQEIGTVLLQRQSDPSLALFAGMGLLLVGLAFKIGIVPFHFWIPDVYEGAPASVTAFMAAGTKVAAFAALVRILRTGFAGDDFALRWAPLLGILAALTMTFANVIALSQTNLKRLLAYSSVAHAGYLMLAVATNTVQGVESLTFYLLAYVFANLGAFAVAVSVGSGDNEKEEGYRLVDLAGLGRRRPGMAAAMTVFMLSLTGIPPTAGFLGKWFIFRSAVDADLLGLAIVLAVNSAIAAYYYLGVIVKMYMVEPDGEPSFPPRRAALSFAAVVAVAATFYLGMYPTDVLEFVTDMAVRFWGQAHLV
jgi:NADH-quinone oxidoreductase subunit N